jgi:hypothetical protein
MKVFSEFINTLSRFREDMGWKIETAGQRPVAAPEVSSKY